MKMKQGDKSLKKVHLPQVIYSSEVTTDVRRYRKRYALLGHIAHVIAKEINHLLAAIRDLTRRNTRI
ncbi:hypothetical protein BWQ96_10875 [Gracilariopsis chorda]|uniref:Uncharacterized protein n=1 Tax=Gracilariopsis chorda TaxID=448386 RepID=A0A2V3IE17_9FLOR|nr:hypothetical protein BWQ96_10875 [Gracilariopsis chorda]|eukprot:PXF39440.1 hypothetical protein BWQ96_10875 [Gracilariopsis chorda]